MLLPLQSFSQLLYPSFVITRKKGVKPWFVRWQLLAVMTEIRSNLGEWQKRDIVASQTYPPSSACITMPMRC